VGERDEKRGDVIVLVMYAFLGGWRHGIVGAVVGYASRGDFRRGHPEVVKIK
jgi:hypothetical protein